jgi:membrane protein DedA with SNARE-associated domain
MPTLLLELIKFKYLLLFPIAVAEGPAITIIAGFLSSLGFLNFWISFAVIVVGDLVGDSIFYAIGRHGRDSIFYRYGKYLGLHPERLQKVEDMIAKNHTKTLLFGKFAHGTGSILWVGTGLAKMPYRKFLIYNFFTTCIKSGLLIVLGYYYGEAYERFGTVFHYLSIGFILLLVIGYILSLKTNLFSRIVDHETK